MGSENLKNMAMVANSTPSLEYKEISVPRPGQGQVVIEILYTAQNPTDGELHRTFDERLS